MDEQRREELVDKLLQDIERITYDYEEYEEYSGRGMFGDTSSLAIVVPDPPNSAVGRKLQDLGLTCDNLGRNYVYYTRW